MAFRTPKTVDAVTALLSIAAISSAFLAFMGISLVYTGSSSRVATDRLWILPVIAMLFGFAALWSHKEDQKRK